MSISIEDSRIVTISSKTNTNLACKLEFLPRKKAIITLMNISPSRVSDIIEVLEKVLEELKSE